MVSRGLRWRVSRRRKPSIAVEAEAALAAQAQANFEALKADHFALSSGRGELRSRGRAVVIEERGRNPQGELDELCERAREIDPSIGELSWRQFHGRYPLQAKRIAASGRPRKQGAAKRRSGAEQAGGKRAQPAVAQARRGGRRAAGRPDGSASTGAASSRDANPRRVPGVRQRLRPGRDEAGDRARVERGGWLRGEGGEAPLDVSTAQCTTLYPGMQPISTHV